MAQQIFKLKPLNRTKVCDSYFIEKLGTTIEFLIALPEDKEVVLEYCTEVAYKVKPIDHALKMTKEQYRDLYDKHTINEFLSKPFTILAVQNSNELCGIVSGIILKLESKERRPIKFEDDYGEALKKYEDPIKAVRLLTCFFRELQAFMPNFLPPDCEEFMRIRSLVVSEHLQGHGIGTKLWLGLMKLAKNAGVKFITTSSTSDASIQIAKNTGLKPMLTYKYGDFKINGEQIFGNKLVDGSTEIQILVGDLREIDL